MTASDACYAYLLMAALLAHVREPYRILLPYGPLCSILVLQFNSSIWSYSVCKLCNSSCLSTYRWSNRPFCGVAGSVLRSSSTENHALFAFELEASIDGFIVSSIYVSLSPLTIISTATMFGSPSCASSARGKSSVRSTLLTHRGGAAVPTCLHPAT
ncbi:hypothetical protein F4823DRAFT_33091 [Ustulina deusta]|nr:hypothetical protein F4823DRAFT_33091 [Ustulina deusta]